MAKGEGVRIEEQLETEEEEKEENMEEHLTVYQGPFRKDCALFLGSTIATAIILLGRKYLAISHNFFLSRYGKVAITQSSANCTVPSFRGQFGV